MTQRPAKPRVASNARTAVRAAKAARDNRLAAAGFSVTVENNLSRI